MTSREQIDKLAKFIMEEDYDEPSESAVDTVIRIIRELKDELEGARDLMS